MILGKLRHRSGEQKGDYILKFNHSSRIRALELLGKHAKMFSDRVEHSGTIVTYSTDFGDGAGAAQGSTSRQ